MPSDTTDEFTLAPIVAVSYTLAVFPVKVAIVVVAPEFPSENTVQLTVGVGLKISASMAICVHPVIETPFHLYTFVPISKCTSYVSVYSKILTTLFVEF